MALKMTQKTEKVQLSSDDKHFSIMDYLGLWSRFNNVNAVLQGLGEDEGGVWELHNPNHVILRVDLGDYRHEIKVVVDKYAELQLAYATFKDVTDHAESYLDNELLELHNGILEGVSDFITESEARAAKLANDYKEPPTTEVYGMDLAEGTPSSPTGGMSWGGVMAIQAPNYYCKALEADPAKAAKNIQDATQLYQAVKGTTVGSRYHVVLITNTGVTVAARLKNNAYFSLRAIAKTDEDKERLTQLGFASSSGSDHLSVHFSPCTPDEAQRTLGALMALFPPTTINTGLPVLNVFKEYGA